jgi:glutamyl-tRNA synthetase
MTKKVVRNDEIRGEISMADNYNDIVIFKKDGLPTYHLAHIVDDTLMRTTLVSRGDEWLPSVPLHLQLFSAFGLPAPKYAHLAPVCKMDEGKKRKLSKRHDPEANVAFLFEKGYAAQGIIEYIFTLLNSNFEDWRRESPDVDVSKFHLSFATMNVAGPLFDETKLQWVNNGYLSRISTEELFTQTLEWAKEYAPAFSSLLLSDVEYAKVAMNIERHTEKDPKRFTLYSDVQHQLLFFFDSEWEKGESVREELFAGLAPLPSASCSTAGEKIGSSDVLVP